ncbi:MAG TPA: anti-sigma factor [Friedmanniella sp.]
MAHPTPDVLVLVALGEDGDAEVLQHVRECRACFAEIEALQQVVTVGRSLGPDDRLVAPHPRVWARINANLGGARDDTRPGSLSLLERPGPDRPSLDEPSLDEPSLDRAAPEREPVGVGTTDELAARRRPAPRRWGVIALAAAVALIVGLAGGFLLKGLVPTTSAAGGSTTTLNALPSWAGANGTAKIQDGGDGQRTLVVTMDLPATVDVQGTMEVWMSDTRAEDMIDMGTMTGTTAQFAIPANLDVATHPIIDVSLEPKGDTDPHHSDVSVVRGRLNV